MNVAPFQGLLAMLIPPRTLTRPCALVESFPDENRTDCTWYVIEGSSQRIVQDEIDEKMQLVAHCTGSASFKNPTLIHSGLWQSVGHVVIENK